ncbi:AAA family ATPase [Paenibacillus profundus]|uniref:AAA family ATPase n=1 Tax=Paenibacillus profundus TaxID=1173085 RepID=A0ABS8YKV9_9BACL|nr:AAA family ATPase [Paenibacillus profundus]MCE5171824.1 AAA family ATPase [Paenibacillus profundus]
MIKDFSTVFWGHLPMTKEPYKAHEKVNAFVGPSGHGKTTIWDGLRLMLGASHFESKRTFSFYVQKSNWAVVRVAFNNFSVNGIRPFEPVRKFKEEVTACCRIYKNDQKSWSRDYYLFDGKFYDLADLQLNSKAYSEAYLNVSEYLHILEECLGVTKEFRNLMAMNPDNVREVVNSSPHELFDLVFNLKGTKDYKKRYDESKQRLGVQELAIEQAEEEMDQAKNRFEVTSQKAEKFRLYQEKEIEVERTEIILKKLEYFEFQEELKSTKEEMDRVEKTGRFESDKVNEITVKFNVKQKEIEQLILESDRLGDIEEQANQDITQYTVDKARIDTQIEEIDEQINCLKQIEPQNVDYLNELKEMLTADLEQTKLDYSQVKTELVHLKRKFSDLEKNLVPYKEEAKKFRQTLVENHIPFIMLADAISVKPEMKSWQKAIESYIGNNRYRIIVEPDNYLSAKKIQQEIRYGARVSLPKKEKVLSIRKNVSYPSIRSAINISHREKVEGYMGRLNNVYLVETVEEGHDLQAKGIESITLEGLLQDEDGAIHLKYHTLCCGKLAIDEEIKETKELLNEKEKIVNELEDSISKQESELGEVNSAINNQKLLARLPDLENSYHLLREESTKLSVLIDDTTKEKDKVKHELVENRNKERKIGAVQSGLAEERARSLQKAEDLLKQHTDLHEKFSYLTSITEQALTEVQALGLSDDEIEFISYDVQGSAFRNQQGDLFTSKELQNRLNELLEEKRKLYDNSVSEEIVRLVEAQQGQVELLAQNLRNLKEDRDKLERTCDDLLYQFRNHIKEIMKNYITEFENLADLLKASAKGRLVEVTPEPETWEIQLFIGYDGKEPVAVDGPHLSSGQKACTSLMILLAALSDNQKGTTTPIMFLDEPKARVDDERGNEIGQLLQVTNIQYFITHQQGESLKTIDWIDHAFTCSASEPGKEFAHPLILKKRASRSHW